MEKFILANVTGLFGFIWPSAYISAGAWSIGNEIVYYAFTPIMIMAFNQSRVIGNTAVAIATLIGVMFSFIWIDSLVTLADQWKIYINPFNNIYLYLSGVAIFYNLRNVEASSKWKRLLFVAPVMLFIAYPVEGDQINAVTGFNRIVLSSAAIMTVITFYKVPPKLPTICDRWLRHLGHISYGVYLLHPFAIDGTKYLMAESEYPLIFVSCVCLITFAFAQVVYSLLEKPAIALGKYVTQRGPFAGSLSSDAKLPTI